MTSTASAAIHPIHIVARRTGLTAELIRAWERRYGCVTPARTETQRRLYTEQDVRRLLLLRRAVDGGRRIGDVASLDCDVIETLLAEDVPEGDAARPEPAATAAQTRGFDVDAAGLVDAALEAIRSLDGNALRSVLEDAATALSVPALLEQVLAPLLHRLGDGWRDGSLRICHEHLSSGVLRAFLGDLEARNRGGARDTPVIVLATPPGHAHEFGVLMASVMATTCGWQPLYLGAETPIDDIAFATVSRGARAVALGLSWPGDDPRLDGELRRLRQRLPASVELLVGGGAKDCYAETLQAVRARRCQRLDELCEVLQALRLEQPTG